jgi:hypothetical protein
MPYRTSRIKVDAQQPDIRKARTTAIEKNGRLESEEEVLATHEADPCGKALLSMSI